MSEDVYRGKREVITHQRCVTVGPLIRRSGLENLCISAASCRGVEYISTLFLIQEFQ